MTRFSFIDEVGTMGYTPAEIAAMTDEELAQAIRDDPDWNGTLLEDLIWRAFPDTEEEWEIGDALCYRAAEALGVEID